MSLIKIITLLLLLCTANSAVALPLSDYRQKSRDIIEIYVSGASAQDNALESLFRLRCAKNTLDIYRAGGNQRLFFCTIKSDATKILPEIEKFPQQAKVALFKTSRGGSGNGVGPLIQSTHLPFINILDLKKNFQKRCPDEKKIKHKAQAPFDGYTEHFCTNPKRASKIPDVGISDVEPKMFTKQFGFSKAQINRLTVTSANALIFGIPVSLNLRNALQAAQFANDSSCHPDNSEYEKLISDSKIPYSESQDCMPGLTRPQLAGMFAGTITDWRQILNHYGYPMAAIDPDSGEISVPPSVKKPIDTRVHVCRRVDTSGTQASFEIYFLNQRCADNVESFVPASRTVAMSSGTSDVKYCLNTNNSKGLWSVGIFSTENVADLENDGWRFIKVDNAAPTLLNTYLSKWTFFIEQTIQWRNEESDNPLSGFKLQFSKYIAQQAGSPEVIRTINSRFKHTWGSAGVMGLNTNNHRPYLIKPGTKISADVIDENPVLPLSRATQGFPNNCSPPLAVFPTPAP